MTDQENQKIIAVIPAYNEKDQITGVLDAVSKAELLDKIIVVNDGSIDGTAEIAAKYPVTLIDHKKNHGKGAAIQTGINLAFKNKAEILVFLDADMVNLKPYHIRDLIRPLFEESSLIMTIGILKRSDNKNTTPEYSGQRAIRAGFFNHCSDFSKLGFGVELALTNRLKKLAQKKGLKEQNLRKLIPLPGVNHIPKEEKHGPLPGFGARMKMVGEISVTPIHLMKADIKNVLSDLDKFLKELEAKRNLKKQEREIKLIQKKLRKIEKKWQKKSKKNSS